jgi:hypothetical protein
VPETTPQPDQEENTLEISIGPDVDYTFRDVFHITAGDGDVLMEFGNRDRLQENHIRIGNRIVLTVREAYRLSQKLDKALAEAHLRAQQTFHEPSTEEA